MPRARRSFQFETASYSKLASVCVGSVCTPADKMVHQFEKCCCFDLRTGTIIIGALGILGGLCYGVSPLVGAKTSSTTRDEGDQGSTSRIISVIVGIVTIILNVALIMGAVKRNHKLVYPWIIVTAICTVINIINGIVVIIFILLGGHIGTGIGALIVLIIYALIEVYLILIVNSFYTNLKNGEQVATQTA